MVEHIQKLLLKPELLEPAAPSQWRFRLARLGGADNPYGHLVPEALQEMADRTIRTCLRHGHPLAIDLNGGIGDHLEALSLVLPWAQQMELRVELRSESKRRQQLSALLSELGYVGWTRAAGLPVMALRHWLCAQSRRGTYGSWLKPSDDPAPISSGLLCCWRAEGAGDRLSAHARSIPFDLVRAFYARTLRERPSIRITDISHWKPWEAQLLLGMGIRLHDPSQGNLAELSHLALDHHVISIDTALAHLCAALGHAATLLLPRFCDERWHELYQPRHSYGRWLRIQQSAQFGSWQGLMDSLAPLDWA
jgi:hypothetical protein